MGPIRQQPTPAIAVFAGLNFVLAGLSLLWALFFGITLVYGVFFSGDTGQQLAFGVVGCVLLGLPGVLGIVIYAAAGLGLVLRRRWGYYLHIAGAVLAALTCLGAAYTIPAFLFAFRPEFSAPFFSSADQAPRRWPDESERRDETEADLEDHRADGRYRSGP